MAHIFFVFSLRAPHTATMESDSKCENCTVAVVHTRAATVGSEVTLGALPCYLARVETSTTPTSCILLLTDIFGYALPNVRLLADRLASLTALPVYVPDILLGDACSTDFDRSTFGAWRARHGDAETLPPVREAVAALRTLGFTKIAANGYCFGGRYSIMLAQGPTPSIEAFGVAHPSFIDAATFATVRAPGFFACAETDQQFPEPLAAEVETLLKANGVKAEFRRYAGTTHGFAVRGAEDDERVMKARDDALEGLAEFALKHLA